MLFGCFSLQCVVMLQLGSLIMSGDGFNEFQFQSRLQILLGLKIKFEPAYVELSKPKKVTSLTRDLIRARPLRLFLF